jgi:hypothetical protein
MAASKANLLLVGVGPHRRMALQFAANCLIDDAHAQICSIEGISPELRVRT